MMLDENSFWQETSLIRYLESLALLRVKGIVAIKEGGFLLINGVDADIEIKEVSSISEKCRLEFISSAKININEISKSVNQLIEVD